MIVSDEHLLVDFRYTSYRIFKVTLLITVCYSNNPHNLA